MDLYPRGRGHRYAGIAYVWTTDRNAHGQSNCGTATDTVDARVSLVIFIMWWLMMIAMMLPSGSPSILLFAALTRNRRETGAPYMETGLFGSGYLAVWVGFSLLAVTLQWQLNRIALLSPMMLTTSKTLGALLLIGAGVWQFTAQARLFAPLSLAGGVPDPSFGGQGLPEPFIWAFDMAPTASAAAG